jgi:hypothetical protein
MKRFALLWRRFSPLEEKLLEAVRRALAPSARAIFDAQVAAITKVQRHPEWTEIAFYRMRGGKVDWKGVPLFPRSEELPLAEVRFKAGGRAFKARLTAIDGHIFDFAVTPGPKGVAFAEWEGDPSVAALSDPEDRSAPAPVEVVPDAWRDFLAEVLSSRGAPDAPRAHPEWALYGDGEAYRVALDEGEFLILAELRGERFLLYRLEPKPGAFFLQNGHDAPPGRVAGDFREALRRGVG